MIKATNLKLDRTLTLRKHRIGPGETALIECKESDVKGHLFVRLGYIHVDAGKSGRPKTEAPANPAMGEAGDEGGAE